MKVARIDALFQPTVKMLVGLSYLIGLVYGAYLVFQSKVTLGELVSFNVFRDDDLADVCNWGIN